MVFAGSRELLIGAGRQGAALSALLHYPTEVPSQVTRFGPYELDVSVDAPVAPGRHPLVLISHGGGGSPLLYRIISLTLARSGYVVALPRHSGNTLGDNALAESAELWRLRPAQLVAVLDAVFASPLLGPVIADEAVTGIGHSMGGYTVLSTAGGVPWTRSRERIPVERDARLARLVLLAPACGPFLAPQSLAGVNAPILALTAEHDSLTPDAEIRAALASAPDQDRVIIRTVTGAGHFSFLSPFPRQMITPQFAPSQDPSGFDRERFHQRLAGLILEWIAGGGSLGSLSTLDGMLSSI